MLLGLVTGIYEKQDLVETLARCLRQVQNPKDPTFEREKKLYAYLTLHPLSHCHEQLLDLDARSAQGFRARDPYSKLGIPYSGGGAYDSISCMLILSYTTILTVEMSLIWSVDLRDQTYWMREKMYELLL